MLGGKPARKSVFISYSSKDEKYLKELQIHLDPYNIDVWDDTKISAGLLRRDALQRALQCTKVAVFLVSADFLASDFIINQELSPLLKIAEQEDITILPVILRPCDFHNSELAQFQAVNLPSEPLALIEPEAKREIVWDSLAKQIWEILKSVTSQQSKLDIVLGEMSKTIVTDTQLQQLLLILSTRVWPLQVLKHAYRVSNPTGRLSPLSISKHPDPLLLMPLIIKDLASLPLQSDGTIPLLVFALCLHTYAQQQEEKGYQTALHKWINERIEECKIDVYQLQRRANELQLHTSYHLLIMLDPESKDLFYIYAWLLDSNNTVLPKVNTGYENEPITLEKVPIILEVLLEQCEDYLVDKMEKLVIEFLLPEKLLYHPVDDYLFDSGMKVVKLGIQYPVVVRSLERVKTKRGKKMRIDWEKKWNLLEDGQGRAWICERDQYETDDSLYSTLIDSSLVCFGLTYVPPDESDDTVHNMLAAGIPAALLPRMNADSPETISELLKSDKLFSLPSLIQEQRIAASRSKDNRHQGHHLTLLWDNPNRHPEDAPQFAMPSVRKGV